MKKLIIYIVLLILISLPDYAFSYKEATHRALNYSVANNQNNLPNMADCLKNKLGYSSVKDEVNGMQIIKWFENAGAQEDAIPRFTNHFHEPISNKGFAGMFDPAPLWAQKAAGNQWPGGAYSWLDARQYFYRSLTGTNKADREFDLTGSFRSLGQVMHLVQDMSVPEHTRDTGHPIQYTYETWVEKVASNRTHQYRNMFNNLLANPVSPDPALLRQVAFLSGVTVPISNLFDINIYNGTNPGVSVSNAIGLAEFSNANFFSFNTIFKNFPYPAPSSTLEYKTIDPISGKIRTFVRKTSDGETMEHLAQTTFFTKHLALNKGYTLENDLIYFDYMSKLLPRAVGYSAALLDYFFRGTIKVEPVSINNSTITVSAKNTTTNGDAMTGGTLDLVLRYRQIDDSNQLLNVIPFTDYQYMDIKYPINNQTIDTTAKLFTFDISATPLPNWANDVTAFLVYHGQLGNESDAVAVGQTVLRSHPRKMTLALPSAGVYGKTSGSTGFTRITVAATANIPGLDLADGLIELVMIHRTADSDPFQNVPVTTSPANPLMYNYNRASEETGKRTLSQGQTTELTFNISDTPLPIWASDVYMYISYKKAGDPDSMAMAVGFLDISEPTPVDVFNNADKICLNSQWYNAGSAEAIALVDINHDGVAQEVDVYANNVTNIYYKASSIGAATPASDTVFTLNSPNKLYGGSSRRLGYILTDYSFNSSFTQDWVDGPSFWGEWTTTELNIGTAVKHQTDPDGKYTYPGMQVIRGNKIWWGTGLIYDNYEYPADGSSVCSWDTL